MTVQEWLGENNQLGIDIWTKKYQFENETFDEWLDRVSNGDADVKQLIIEKKFLFGGRILSNRGLEKKGVKTTLSNCYVITPPEDSIESIFECAAKLARTYSYGGGCGVDISKLAPKGARVRNTAKATSGSVSFMDLYSLVTGLIGQNGRRGALMISLACNHPDIEDFIEIKSDLERVTKANISIRITDKFMYAVENNEDFVLSFTREETNDTITKIINARELFHKICEMNWNYAEPGMLFWDRIEGWNLLSEDGNFHYAGTNPCAEEPLPAGGSCLLGSINLAEFVKEDKTFDFTDFRKTVNIAVMALNKVLDEGLPLHPLQEQRDSVRDWRQIGLGIFGLADMLIKMGIRYGSQESIALCDYIGFEMADEAIGTSSIIAKIKGVYPKYSSGAVLNSEYLKYNAARDTYDLVIRYGLNNSQLLTIAPTGSLSSMLGVSGGIEPIFANYYTRKTESLHSKDEYYKVYTPIVEQYMKEHNVTDDALLPDFFVTAQNLDYKERIDMQAIWQKHIDASISSTVNVPNSFTVEDTENLYMLAWKKGLKGVTIFRDGCERAAILSTSETKTDDNAENVNKTENNNKYNYITPVSRKTIGVTSGKTYCKKCACGTLYITINCDDDNNVVETFIHTSKGGICQANIGAVTRMISVGLRSGVRIEEIIDQLKGITCPACVKLIGKGEKLDGISCPDILGKTIAEFYKNKDNIVNTKKEDIKETKTNQTFNNGNCPDCGANVIYTDGCVQCMECGWTKCS